MEVFNNVRTQLGPQVDTASHVTNDRAVEESSQVKQAEKEPKVGTNEDLNDPKETQKQLDDAIKSLNLKAEALQTNIQFGFNDKIESMFVDVTEKDSGKLIRKIPSEEAIKLAEKMKEVVGMIFDEKS